MCLLIGHFVKFKIRHIFIMQFGGYFVKFYYHQIFRPYGTLLHCEFPNYSLGQIAFVFLSFICYHTAITQLLCHVSLLLTSACKQA